MFRNRVLVLGGFLAAALLVIGCGSSTPKPDSGAAGGTTGTGGALADGGAGRDGGTGGAAPDGGAGRDGGTGGAAPDGGAGRDGAADAGDTGVDLAGPCTTTFGAGNPVQYAFNGGANDGWIHFLNDPASSGVTTALGSSFTDGHSCAGALLLAVNFVAYGLPNAQAPSGSTEFYFGATPNGRNWSAYKNLHAWIKVQTADYQQLAGVYFYVKSGSQMKYQAAPVAMGSDLSNGRFQEVVVDLTNPGTGPFNGVTANDIQLIGFQVLLNMAPPTGAPATPSQVILLADDIWLEALPPVDAGADGSDGAAGGDAALDAPSGG